MSEATEELSSYSNIKRISDEELEEIWAEYIDGNKESKELRDKIILQYLYLPRYVVNRMKSTFPPECSLEDVLGFGVEGLINAVERYSQQKGTKFETYALVRIRGNIIDRIRSQDLLPRNVRKRIKEIKFIAEKLRQQLGRIPTSAEIGKVFGMSGDKVDEILSSDTGVSSLYDKKGPDENSVEVIDTLIDNSEKLPLEALEEKDTKRELQHALNRLPEKEKTVLVLYYHENMTFKEIAEIIKMSESRACQIHSRAIMKLRKILSESRSERLSKSIV